MYDPLVVDTFIATYGEIAPPLTPENPGRVSAVAHHLAAHDGVMPAEEVWTSFVKHRGNVRSF